MSTRNRILRRSLLISLIVLSMLVSLLTLQATHRAHAAASMLNLRVPWTYGTYKINGGNSYGCGDHKGFFFGDTQENDAQHDYSTFNDHYAIDFALPNGTYVSAVADGTVGGVGYEAVNGIGLGNYVWIIHANGWVSRYAHLQKALVNKGDTVQQGQPIAISGYSGLPNSSDVHLHFSLRSGATTQWNGNSTAPEPMYGDKGVAYSGFGTYGACGSQSKSPDYTAPAPGGWWIGPTPTGSNQNPIPANTNVNIGFQSSDTNSNGGIAYVNLTRWTASSNTWTSVKVPPDKNGQVFASFNFTEPTIISADVYANNQRFQLAPNGVRFLCVKNAGAPTCPPSNIAYWDGSSLSGGVGGGGQNGSCSASGSGVTLFVDANYGGNCHTFGVGEYSDLSQFGLDQNVSSFQDTNGAYHITFFDQKDLTGTPGYYDSDTSQLTGYWNDRARSMRVELHRPTSCNTGTDGIAAYLNNDYQNGCIFITGDIPDLTTLNFDHIMASIRFVGSYVNTKQLAIYRQANYQDLCGTYSLDQSDLRNCAGVAVSVQVQPFTPPTQAQNLAPSAILDHPGSGNAVDNNLSTEWIGGHSVPLGLVFASPVTIQDIVVFDRAQSSTDNNQINKLQLVFSDGTVINNIDMTSGGPRCADVSFPAKQVSWVNVVPTDASGNNGFREIQIWDTSGAVYTQNNCVMKFSMTPVPGSGPAPLIQPPTPTPTPSQTPSPTSIPSPTPTASCPAGWTCADIGGPNLTGSESLSNGIWSIQGSGGDIWNTSDQFHYDWQTLPGDGSFSAQVLTQDNTDAWAKAGVMFRQDNSAGSAFYLVALTSGNGITVQYRTDQGVNARMNAQISGGLPVYLQAIRVGNTFTAATSSDGVTWNTISGSSATLNMSGTVLAGLAITSHSALLGTATFNSVSISPATPTSTPTPSPTPTASCPAGWTCADIGSPNVSGGESLQNGTWSVQGSGGDIWNASDQFHYDWQSLSGDGSVSAQVLTQDNTDAWAKAGVMFRQDNTAGSAFYMVALTPGNGITVQYRTDQGVNAQMNAQISGMTPVYVMAVRTGNTFMAAISSDGVSWTTISGSSATLNVSGTMLAGLEVTSHSASLGTVTFNSVNITAGTTPSPTPTTPTPTTSPSPTSNGVELLPAPWHLSGNNGASELYQSVDPNVLNGKTRVQITFNLHGLQALGNDASAIIIDQNGWHYISLANYGQNGLDGNQTVIIPLSDFGLDLTQPIDGTIHTRFWYGSQFTVDIISIQLLP